MSYIGHLIIVTWELFSRDQKIRKSDILELILVDNYSKLKVKISKLKSSLTKKQELKVATLRRKNNCL